MPTEISYPGVYVEEIPNGVKPISGVDTSITAFAGWAPMGPVDRAEMICSWTDFEKTFGGLDSRSLLAYSVRHFFQNGGLKAYVVRLVADGEGSDSRVLDPNQAEFEQALLPASGSGGLYHLDGVDLFNLLCVPGETNVETINALQKFCLERRAFLIADCPEAAKFENVDAAVTKLTGEDSVNSAFYFPWVLAPDELQENSPREFPPCGFVAGIIARTDAARGVWKAPAGIEAVLRGSLGVAADKNINDDQNGILNPKGINCVRTFSIHGTVVWGARTLRGSNDLASEWKYVPVRRTSLFIEESIYRGIRWAVFEPNDEPLWAKIRMTVGNFMFELFRAGAFQGAKPEQAYFVKCDRTTTTQSDVNRGVVNILVGFAPLKPAEFVIIRIQQMAGQIEVASPDLAENTMNRFTVNPRRYDPYRDFKFLIRPDGSFLEGAFKVVPSATREDLLLLQRDLGFLDEIVERVGHGPADDKSDLGATAIFIGQKGTGKTMAAEVIAGRLGLDIYRIDLSEVVSEYIGETEKNLRDVFDAAEAAGTVLLFDEADALLGKRSDVKDSHDRYANIEVGYLLQRLEEFDGVAILATTRKKDLDEAFLRRLRYVVNF